MEQAHKILFIVDGNAYIHRAYHALPPLTTSTGQQINAVFGFTKMLLKIIRENAPEFMVICFDTPEPTEKHKIYPEYKSTRKKIDEELALQIPLAKEAVQALNLPLLEKVGYEADDLIGTLTKLATSRGLEVIIITGDKDALQLVSDNVKVLNEHKNILYDRNKILEIYNLQPQKLVDVFALSGDPTDNIPGVKGIGTKTALKLIHEYGGLEDLYNNINNVSEKLAKKLKTDREKAFLSKHLAKINCEVPLEVTLEDLAIKKPTKESLLQFIRKMEFSSLLKEFVSENKESTNYKTIISENEFENLIAVLTTQDKIAIDLETNHVNPHYADIVGISISFAPYTGYYIPVGHNYDGMPKQLPKQLVFTRLKPLLEEMRIKKYGQNIKYDLLCLRKYGIELKGIYFDSMIASYLLNPGKATHNLDDIAMEYLLYKKIPIAKLLGKGKTQITMEKVTIEQATNYSCEDSDIVLRLGEVLLPQLQEKKLTKLFFELEIPLLLVLSEMEYCGIKVDLDYLQNLSQQLDEKIVKATQEIYQIAGQEFNINSPKQLEFILFKKLQLPHTKRTKTGYSTDEEVLNILSKVHILPAKILEYRQLQKYKSTYVDALLNLVDKETNRIHTSFNQTVTATGRLSSSEPNLQNIPIRTDLGHKIRKAFIPEKGHIFVSADYSQIDLRVLAHMSEDELLCSAFNENKDIHAMTAKEIFNAEQITPELRRIAKTINFGIIYGISAYGLAQQLYIPVQQAQAYIDNYFNKYKGVKLWIEKTLEQARKDGYVSTLLNRIRYLEEINSPNNQIRSFAERVAINTPIQGSAADIIKLAMLNLANKFIAEKMRTKMLLQVHDELLFELPNEERDKSIQIIKYEMENAMKLIVPLVVDIKIGTNWAELSSLSLSPSHKEAVS